MLSYYQRSKKENYNTPVTLCAVKNMNSSEQLWKEKSKETDRVEEDETCD